MKGGSWEVCCVAELDARVRVGQADARRVRIGTVLADSTGCNGTEPQGLLVMEPQDVLSLSRKQAASPNTKAKKAQTIIRANPPLNHDLRA
eukprot:3233965-Rhodomonas_salina.1